MANYTSHAIDSLKLYKNKLSKNAPLSSDAIGRMIGIMQNYPKFMLPDKGRLIFDEKGIPAGIGMTRLPFPKVVIEVPYTHEIYDEETTVPSTKRIIIAEEGMCTLPGTESPEEIGFREAQSMEIPNGIKMSVCSYYDQEKMWMLQSASAVVTFEMKSLKSQDIKDDPYRENRRGGVAIPFLPVPLLPEIDQHMLEIKGVREYSATASNDLGTELIILAEMLTVLSCRNVGTEIIKPQEKLNKARIKKGREPFYEYRVLTVGNTPLYASAKGDDYDGSYKVKQHLRRGHIRKIAENHTIWVNQTVVAAGSDKGILDKDYRLKT